LSAVYQNLRKELLLLAETAPRPSSRSRHVSELLRFIHESIFESGLSVKVALNRCGIRDHNVSSQFKYEVGVSIKDYITRLRLDCAERCIADGNWPIAAIAQAAGFGHVQTFYALYRRTRSGTPGQIRRKQSA